MQPKRCCYGCETVSFYIRLFIHLLHILARGHTENLLEADGEVFGRTEAEFIGYVGYIM